MKKSEWVADLSMWLTWNSIDPDDVISALSLTEYFSSKGWLPPARTEHGITKHDWEPEDE